MMKEKIELGELFKAHLGENFAVAQSLLEMLRGSAHPFPYGQQSTRVLSMTFRSRQFLALLIVSRIITVVEVPGWNSPYILAIRQLYWQLDNPT